MKYSTIQLLTETKLPQLLNNAPSEVVEFIKKNCQPWLKQASDRIVWRGLKTPINAPSVVNIRMDRSPRDTEKEIHDLFNNVIANAGLTANRSNSIFATSDIDSAIEFAWNPSSVAAVFPIGPFKYSWSTVVKDATANFANQFGETVDVTDKQEMASILSHITTAKWWQGDDNSLPDAIASGHEIMISCPTAYLVPFSV